MNKHNIGQKNKIKIIRMREAGKSLHQTAIAVGLTGERVRQLERIFGLPPRGLKLCKRVKRKCANPKCRKVMDLKVTDLRLNCCRKCFYDGRPKKTIEQKREAWRKKQAKYYHEVMKKRPDIKEYIRKCNNKYKKTCQQKKQKKILKKQ